MSEVFEKVDLFDAGSKLADTDLLASDISPSRTKSVFRIQVGIGSVNAKFSVVVKKVGSTDRLLRFNGDSNLRKDTLYTFTMTARKPKTYNFQFDKAVDLYLLEIEEVEGPVI